jgi:hypothetical protein
MSMLTHSIMMLMQVKSGPIIEHSDRLRFGAIDIKYPGLDNELTAAGFSADVGPWSAVQVSSHLAPSAPKH